MNIRKIGIPAIMNDNEMSYLHHIIKAINIIDSECDLIISKSISGYGFTLRHSSEKLKDLLMRQIQAAHDVLGLDMEFSHHKLSPFITFRLLPR